MKYLSAEEEFDVPAIEHTSTLKMYLVKSFADDIALSYQANTWWSILFTLIHEITHLQPSMAMAYEMLT